MGARYKELKGEVYGRLTVIEYHGKNKIKSRLWKCNCSCGNITIVVGAHLASGNTKSCGCLSVDTARRLSTKHGKCNTGSYASWRQMKSRCLNENATNSEYYKNVALCDRWTDFENFYKDMGDRPKLKTIDRIDGSKGYSPENCRWATRKEQANNTKSNNNLTFNGKTQSISKWADEYKMDRWLLDTRIKSGLSVKESLEKPKGKYVKKSLYWENSD